MPCFSQMRRLRTLMILVVLAMAAVPAAAEARTNVRVGIADQNAAMFNAARYRSLHLKITRYFIRWDAKNVPGDIAAADNFVRTARKRHVRVLMHISTNTFVEKAAHLPSLSEYKRDVGYLVRRYRKLGVRDWGSWNEMNHKTQPTYKSPKRAAQYFKVMRGMCKGCRVVPLNILARAGSASYIRRYFKAMGSYRRHV